MDAIEKSRAILNDICKDPEKKKALIESINNTSDVKYEGPTLDEFIQETKRYRNENIFRRIGLYIDKGYSVLFQNKYISVYYHRIKGDADFTNLETRGNIYFLPSIFISWNCENYETGTHKGQDEISLLNFVWLLFRYSIKLKLKYKQHPKH